MTEKCILLDKLIRARTQTSLSNVGWLTGVKTPRNILVYLLYHSGPEIRSIPENH